MWKLLLLFARMRIGNFTQSEFELEFSLGSSPGLSLIRESGCCQTPTVVSGRDRDVDVAEDLVVGWGSLRNRLALPLGLPSGSGRQRFAPVTSFSAICSIFHSVVFFIFHLSFPLVAAQND